MFSGTDLLVIHSKQSLHGKVEPGSWVKFQVGTRRTRPVAINYVAFASCRAGELTLQACNMEWQMEKGAEQRNPEEFCCTQAQRFEFEQPPQDSQIDIEDEQAQTQRLCKSAMLVVLQVEFENEAYIAEMDPTEFKLMKTAQAWDCYHGAD